METQMERFMVMQVKGNEPIQVDGLSNSAQQFHTTIWDSSHTMQREELLPKQEQIHRVLTPPTSTPHEVDKHIRVDVPDFNDEQNVDVFLD